MADIIIRPNADERYLRELQGLEAEYRKIVSQPMPEFDPGTGLFDVPDEEKAPLPMTVRGVVDLARTWAIHGLRVDAKLSRDTLRVVFTRSNGFSQKSRHVDFALNAPLPFESQVRSVFDDLGNLVRC